MSEQEVLHGKFDVETHKRTFVNYLEVIILRDGTIEYAIPSHQEKLISICIKKLNITQQELYSMCPPEYHTNFMEWLCMKAAAVSVWNEFRIGDCNPEQKKSLDLLKTNGLYKGA